METNGQIKNIIEQALEILYRTEKELIDDGTHEQTISARLMHHLQHLLPDWNVDVEFNRQGENRVTKTDANGTKELGDGSLLPKQFTNSFIYLNNPFCEAVVEEKKC